MSPQEFQPQGPGFKGVLHVLGQFLSIGIGSADGHAGIESVQHGHADPGTLLSYALNHVFYLTATVQGTGHADPGQHPKADRSDNRSQVNVSIYQAGQNQLADSVVNLLSLVRGDFWLHCYHPAASQSDVKQT
jgi:hypothetical protein